MKMKRNNIKEIIENIKRTNTKEITCNILERIFVGVFSGLGVMDFILHLLTVLQDFRNYGICWEGNMKRQNKFLKEVNIYGKEMKNGKIHGR